MYSIAIGIAKYPKQYVPTELNQLHGFANSSYVISSVCIYYTSQFTRSNRVYCFYFWCLQLIVLYHIVSYCVSGCSLNYSFQLHSNIKMQNFHTHTVYLAQQTIDRYSDIFRSSIMSFSLGDILVDLTRLVGYLVLTLFLFLLSFFFLFTLYIFDVYKHI